MPLSDIVNVNITRQTQTVSQAGFGTLMILDTHKAFNDRIRFYNSLSAVAEDFSPSSKAYIAAQDVFAQSPRPTRLAIGRRAADGVTLDLITAQAPYEYTITINGTPVTIDSQPTVLESTVVLDANLVEFNLVELQVNGNDVGTDVSVISFDADFTSGDSIVATVNGSALTAVNFTSDQSTTIGLLATELLNGTNVDTAVVSGAREITVVFDDQASNVVNSVISSGGSEPNATINDTIGVTFDTDHETTMLAIAALIALEPNISNATVGGDNNRTLTVIGDPNQAGIVNNFTVTLGASQATATITNNAQAVTKASILQTMENKINTTSPSLGVTATANIGTDTLAITADVSGTPYTVKTSTDIINPVEALVTVTQAAPETEYVVRINGLNFSYTSDVEVYDNETIAAALVALINASSFGVSATDNLDGTFTLTGSAEFTLTVSEFLSKDIGFAIQPISPSGIVTDDLDAINNVNSDWYALAYTDRTKATVLQIAAWVETQVKLFGTASNEALIIDTLAGDDTTSLAAQMASLNYVRSFVMYHQDAADDFPECAWFGKTLPTDPGSITWKFKNLASVVATNLTTQQQTNAFNKNCNTYQFVGGVDITQNGTTAQGEFIDITRGIDWLSARIQENVYALLVNSPKVPYTDAGIATVEAEIRRSLDEGVDNNFIADDPQYTVTVPRAASVSPANKAARLLTDVSFQATLAGAVHSVTINGTVSV